MSEDYYKALFERHYADSTRYQALLYHAWETIRSQQKGLKRQAHRIKKLRARLKCFEISSTDGDLSTK